MATLDLNDLDIIIAQMKEEYHVSGPDTLILYKRLKQVPKEKRTVDISDMINGKFHFRKTQLWDEVRHEAHE